ncbi:hypothetical protein AAFN85_12445 [Mucilaginibacter sp. CAU 1740]|uniref:hypothetical protein n=1 Tax=Mucilaginibacter sp. CAU 1740 TaxID=3140365 RepID=UPI00325BAFD4
MINEENKPAFEQPESNLIDGNQPDLSYPERHGFVTAWLVFMMIVNSFAALRYLLQARELSIMMDVPTYIIFALFATGALNVLFAVLLFSWKKIAFYGLGITAVIIFILNLTLHMSVIKALLGLAGFPVLYGILQIKKNDVSAWDYLK